MPEARKRCQSPVVYAGHQLFSQRTLHNLQSASWALLVGRASTKNSICFSSAHFIPLHDSDCCHAAQCWSGCLVPLMQCLEGENRPPALLNSVDNQVLCPPKGNARVQADSSRGAGNERRHCKPNVWMWYYDMGQVHRITLAKAKLQ